jgi:hypothetical protein
MTRHAGVVVYAWGFMPVDVACRVALVAGGFGLLCVIYRRLGLRVI